MYNILYIEIRVDLISDYIGFNNLFQDFLNKSRGFVSSHTYTNFKHKPNNGIYGKNGNFNKYCM